MSRAEVLIRQRSIKNYEILREFYNKHLKHKYPFFGYEKNQRSATDADIEHVRQFFRMYDEFGGSPEKILDQVYQIGDEAKEPYEFLRKLHDLRIFCGNFSVSQYDVPKVRLEMDFELNKNNESNVDYLVDRVFNPNNDTEIEPVSEDKSGLWYFMGLTRMRFRWISDDDGVDKPILNPNDPDLVVDETTVKIECLGNWSILRFLQKYQAPDGNQSNLLDNQTLLLFEIPLSNGKKAKIYVGITASLPTKPGDTYVTTLKVPKTTEEMPPMPKGVTAVARIPMLIEKLATTYSVSYDTEIESGSDDDEYEEIESVDDTDEEDFKEQPQKTNIKKANPKATPRKKRQNVKKTKNKSPKTNSREVMKILESDEVPSIDNEKEKVIDISDEELPE
jgi:hypothetical protein